MKRRGRLRVTGVLCAVLTRERVEGLRACLASLAATAPPADAAVSVLVVENSTDPATRAANAATVGAAVGPYPARIEVEPRLGPPIGRNRALAAAEAGGFAALIFLDDDQTVPADWFVTLLRVWREEQADAVRPLVRWTFEPPGRFRARFEGDPAAPRPRRVRGVRQSASNGVLIDRRVWRDLGLRFDERFPLAGGEDTDFFMRASRAGAVIVETAETFAVERCPASKQRLGWLVRRSFAVGANEALYRTKGYPRWRYAAAGAGQALWFGVLALALAAWPSRGLDALLRAARGAGRIAGALSIDARAYARVHVGGPDR